MSMALEHPPKWIIILVVVAVVLTIFSGARNKVMDVMDSIIGGDEVKGNGMGPQGACPLVYKQQMASFGSAFEEARRNQNTRCLIEVPTPDLYDGYRIVLENNDQDPDKKGTIIGVAQKPFSPQDNCIYNSSDAQDEVERMVRGIVPCYVGKDDSQIYDTFKNNWFKNAPDVMLSEINQEVFGTSIMLAQDGKFDTPYGTHTLEDDLGHTFLYKSTFFGTPALCVLKDESEEDNLFLRRIPLCSEGSGPPEGPKQRYTCILKGKNSGDTFKGDFTFYFNEGEYYCEDHSPDEIKECQAGNKWVRVAKVDKCNGGGFPQSSDEQCCCKNDGDDRHCVRRASDKETKCNEYPGGWVQRSCPLDIASRVGYVST